MALFGMVWIFRIGSDIGDLISAIGIADNQVELLGVFNDGIIIVTYSCLPHIDIVDSVISQAVIT